MGDDYGEEYSGRTSCDSAGCDCAEFEEDADILTDSES